MGSSSYARPGPHARREKTTRRQATATMQVGNDLLGAVRTWATLMSIVVLVAIIAHWLLG